MKLMGVRIHCLNHFSEGHSMRIRPLYIFLFMSALVTPSFAADADDKLKQEIEKLGTSFAASFNNHDSAGIAALFASDAVLVNVAGMHPRADIAKVYDGQFKAGFDHFETVVQSVSPLGPDAALAFGTFHETGKSETGAPLNAMGVWTATDVREGGMWKIRMLTGVLKPPPPK
jgi:uncharacterized protein (TIGR02246 family)